MTRRVLTRNRPVYLSASCTQYKVVELVKAFKQICAAKGISVQQGVLIAAREWLEAGV